MCSLVFARAFSAINFPSPLTPHSARARLRCINNKQGGPLPGVRCDDASAAGRLLKAAGSIFFASSGLLFVLCGVALAAGPVVNTRLRAWVGRRCVWCPP